MKKLIFTLLFIFQFTTIHSQNNLGLKDTLYLFFENNNQTMKIKYLDNNFGLPTYMYKLEINNNTLPIYFTSFLDSEKTKYYSNLDYKPILYRRISKKNSINKKNIKNNNWLKNKILSHNTNNYLYIDFDPIYIVEFDKKGKVIITRVEAIDNID